MTSVRIGQPRNRIDGRAKVTGAAKYAGEYDAPDLAYGYVVTSAIARGAITKIDATAALALPGVLQVFTHDNRPKLAKSAKKYTDDIAPPGSPFRPLYDETIHFSAQPIALVVAETFELARHAASLVHVDYKPEEHETDLEANLADADKPLPRGEMVPPATRGKAKKALEKAAIRLDAEYRCPAEHHNPMEMFATTAVYHKNGKLTVYDKTQGVQNVQHYLCNILDIPTKNVRVIAEYVGGAFGSGLRPQYQVLLAALAALELKRPVRVTLTRQQMWSLGYRPGTWQRIALGASKDGKLEAIGHEVVAMTSRYEDYTEMVTTWSGMLYQCDNVFFDHKVVRLDVVTPCDKRAPGAVWGMFALESAMDELAVKLEIDPIELRLKNYAERDQNGDLPFSSKELRECYRQGADRFDWKRRTPAPQSMRSGNTLIGLGMATGVWESMQLAASASAELTPDGHLTVSSATEDIGTGTYTIMHQIACDLLGLPGENVRFALGDSDLPQAPVEGGSFTAASVGSAVHAVCTTLRERLYNLARKLPNSPLKKAALEDVEFIDGLLRLRDDPNKAIPILDLLRTMKNPLREEASAKPGRKRSKFGCFAHSAIFAEVHIDVDFRTVRVPRIVTAIAGGRILNPKTARSQVMGGIVGGIGTALEEESVIDHTLGRFMTHNLADYHVPVNADVRDIDVIFVDEKDEVVNPLGAKGLGEIGIVGVAAAIANAVHHATARRIRDLPITLDKLL